MLLSPNTLMKYQDTELTLENKKQLLTSSLRVCNYYNNFCTLTDSNGCGLTFLLKTWCHIKTAFLCV